MGRDRDRRRRPTPEQARQKAKEGAGGRRFFHLPKGVVEWEPDKQGSYLLDFLPYEVKSDNHPDRVEKGTVWWKRPFQIHRNVGPNNETVVCPGSLGLKCPLCEDRQRLTKNWDENEEQIKALSSQKWVAHIIQHPDDKDRVAVFAYSRFKFGEPLDKELEEGDNDIQLFFDVKDGKTLKVRFSEEAYQGSKFLKATRFDFVDRDDMDEDEVFEKTVCLDEILDVMPYDKLKALYLQVGDEDKDDNESEKESKKDKDDEPKKEGPKFKKGDKVQFQKGKKTIVGKIKKIEDDEAVVVDEDDEEHDVDLDDLEPVKNETKEEPEPEKAEAPTFEKGDKVQFKLGKKTIVGTVRKVKEDEVVVRDADGEDHEVDLEDVSPAEEEKEDKKKEDDDETLPFQPGDKVTWDDGDEKGTVVKLHDSGKKVKVKDEDDEESWQLIDEVKPLKSKGKEDKGKEEKTLTKGKCPHGYKFAEDCDSHGECEKCKEFDACDEANEELEKAGKAGKSGKK